ncbi:hypothetical protein B0H16DRAFT_1724370 [Mycena metata]|uniref:Uncharacterized protein n=1 Tax=Mycena metata TaxID=1033252 RepID=A0AAD7IKL3_9AGAR|nr:hypothetical protein B0H16DRAFT_1726919 [Mycena metata]KAJ7750854.1 hypothetical protein B0H16DRAFT_1724370 [Mycena metata]
MSQLVKTVLLHAVRPLPPPPVSPRRHHFRGLDGAELRLLLRASMLTTGFIPILPILMPVVPIIPMFMPAIELKAMRLCVVAAWCTAVYWDLGA